MDSPPTSVRLRLIDPSGAELAAPVEWTPALIELLIDSAAWEAAQLTLQGDPIPVSLRRIDGQARVVAEWPRSGPGRYRLRLITDGESDEQILTIAPRKIGFDAYRRLLDDLETRLPVIVALGLQRAGGLAGIRLPPPGQTTLAQELVRLRRATLGVPGRPGLVPALAALAGDPHRMLRSSEFWVRQERARRPHPARLAQAVARPHNWDAAGRPLHVLDSRVDPTADVYENRLVAAFTTEVTLRLRRLVRIFATTGPATLHAEGESLLRQVTLARRQAAFLNDVSPPSSLPTRTTMVLLKRPPYRAALAGYLELHRSVAVRLEEPALAAPLENLPALYQVWGTLHILTALLDVAAMLEFRVTGQRLTGRDQEGVFVRVLPDGQPAVELARQDGCTVRLVPERTIGRTGPLRSISLPQRPDVAIAIERPGRPTEVVIFDPKNKLDGEMIEDIGDGKPRKADIDKMHAYRDAIRDASLARVVSYAATLYPGPEVRYADGIEALSAYPDRAE
ncbi:MAG: restriction endonuclease-like protein [Chloroflexota bacterium]|nr:restriction endonuclease-like protein [Chloroflexota bacterium]